MPLKQQALDPDPKATQQINFKGNLNRKNNEAQNINDNTTIFFLTEEAKATTLHFSRGTVKVFRIYFTLI